MLPTECLRTTGGPTRFVVHLPTRLLDPGQRKPSATSVGPAGIRWRISGEPSTASRSSCSATAARGATARSGRSSTAGGSAPSGSMSAPSRRLRPLPVGPRRPRRRALSAIEADLVPWLAAEPFGDAVRRDGRLRGMNSLSALHQATEVGDWRRFERAARFMGFCGLVHSEYTSGGSTRRGHLTKAGNRHLHLRAQGEGAWSVRPLRGPRSPSVAPRAHRVHQH